MTPVDPKRKLAIQNGGLIFINYGVSLINPSDKESDSQGIHKFNKEVGFHKRWICDGVSISTL